MAWQDSIRGHVGFGWGNTNRPGRPFRKPVAPTTTAPTAAPSVTDALPAPMDTALPVDPTYDAQVAGATRTRDTSVAGLKAQRTAGLAEYGYTESGDPNAPQVAFDPSNPYSRASLLKKSYDQSKAGTNTGMAARGQLYSGAYETAQAANDSSYSQGQDSLEKALQRFLAGNQMSQNEAANAYETGASTAAADRVARAAATKPTPTPTPVVPDTAAATYAAKPFASSPQYRRWRRLGGP